MHVYVDYPEERFERDIMLLVRSEEAHDSSSAAPKPASTRIPQDVIFAARREIHVVQMAATVEQYIVDLIEASRYPERYDKELRKWIQIGASPRGTIGLDKCSRAYAWLRGATTFVRMMCKRSHTTFCGIGFCSVMTHRQKASKRMQSSIRSIQLVAVA